MKLRPAPATLFVLTCASSACHRTAHPTAAHQGSASTTPTTPPAGTTPTNAQTPPEQQVQITAATPGESSVLSVPPTPATGCPATADLATLGPGTVHRELVNRNETWTPEGSPHRLPDGVDVQNGATLTLAPCTTVLVGRGRWFNVSDGAAVVVAGDAQHPIRIGSNESNRAAGDWNGVFLSAHARPTSRFAFTTIEFAGADTSQTQRGCLLTAMAGTDLQNVTLDHCRGFGLVSQDEATFAPSSANVTVSHAEAAGLDHAGAVWFDSMDAVGSLPSGRYTGNAVDEVYLAGRQGGVRASATWRNPGVRYHVADSVTLAVAGPTSPTLTLTPGTQFAMGAGSELDVGWEAEGALIADGQADATRISFGAVASQPDPGAWRGLFFGEHYSRARSRLNYVTIAFAGGSNPQSIYCPWPGSQDPHAAVYVAAAPTNPQMFSHVRFTSVPPNDALIARNWHGATVDFFAAALGNEFTNGGVSCHQTASRGPNDDCPDPASCQ